MKSNLKYIPGNTYGPNNFLLLRRSERVNCQGKHKWGIFRCNCDSHVEFEALMHSVEQGICKGCPECLKKFRQEHTKKCATKYHPGKRIGPNNILFIKESPNKKGNKRVGYFKCPECGREDWETTVSRIIAGDKRCSDCYKKHLSKILIERNKAEAYNLIGKKYNKLSVICLNKNKTEEQGRNYWSCLCNCGNTTIVSTGDLVKKQHPTQSCGCSRKMANAYDLTGKRFGMLVAIEPTNQRKYKSVVWKCKCDCGNMEHYTTADCLVNGKSTTCGCKSASKGEQKIANILDVYQIKYRKEYTFEDCKNIYSLPFDFYLPDYNYCIEYDGIQHFKKTDWTHDSLEKIQHRDSIKNNYCKEHNIKLIRIPYWDFDKINDEYLLSLINN